VVVFHNDLLAKYCHFGDAMATAATRGQPTPSSPS